MEVVAEPRHVKSFARRRELMVERQIAARGVRDRRVLEAMRTVPREVFVPPDLADNAYEDRPLPIAGRQTISQPYIVAFMVEALRLRGGERVLEIGAGSGYAAAVIAEIARDVYAIERIGQLATTAQQNLVAAGSDNVHILHADGTEGWAEHAPFDAILVSAGAPDVPRSLLRQLKVGGSMVVPVGSDPRAQELIRVNRVNEGEFEQEDIADVRFVPLIGKEGWELPDEETLKNRPRVARSRPGVSVSLPGLISSDSTAFTDTSDADFGPILSRIGDARVVLIGEATHGTSEFYKLRARITQRLVEEKGFGIVAIEGDWPDAARIDNYVRHREVAPSEWTAFARFPTWMWRNEETRCFVDWLHDYNLPRDPEEKTAFYGLDLYSLYTSIREVISYLDSIDPELADVARQRYGCLSPWEADPAAYGHAALKGRYQSCERDVANMLAALLARRQDYEQRNGESFLNAEQNASLIKAAERYYRIMYYGSRVSWNMRDSHMFETLSRVMKRRGNEAKAVVWAHNSHIGDARATEMSQRGEHNIGQLCREAFGTDCYAIGFGTHDGTVAAASGWDEPMRTMKIRPAHPQSYERLFHMTNVPGLMLPLRAHDSDQSRDGLLRPRLERAIGVIYRPETELASHYFEARLPEQFDEYIWVDKTSAITPIQTEVMQGLPETYPFGL